MNTPPRMTADDVWSVLDLLHHSGVRVWVDGGWAVDACLGAQTRDHSDLDIVVEKRHLEAAVAALRAVDYGDVPRDDTRPWNFVLGDDGGHEVDFHVVEFDEQGRGICGPPEDDGFYPAGALTGEGFIGGRPVPCAAPEWLVASHTGYELDESDWHDVSALCDRFGIPRPGEYERFRHTR